MNARFVNRLLTPVAAPLMVAGLVLTLAAPVAASTTYSISGHVFLGDMSHPATTGDATVDFTPVGSAHRPQDSVPLAADGSYAITGLIPGQYYVLFHYLGTGPYSSVYWGEQAAITHPYQSVSIIDSNITGSIALPPVGQISGHVAIGTSSQSSASGEVAVSYRVYQGDNQYSAESAPVLTDSSGNYVLPNLAESTDYQIHFVYQGTGAFQSGWFGYSGIAQRDYSDRLPAGGRFGNRAGVSIVLPGFGSISGHISMGSADTPAGAGAVSVSLVYSTNNTDYTPVPGATTTDATGGYSFTGLVDGSYEVVVTYSQDQHFATTTTSSSHYLWYGASATMDLTIPHRFSITGHVNAAPGRSAGAGEITVVLTNWVGTVLASTQTDASGNYRIDQFSGGQTTVVYTFTSPAVGRVYGPDDQSVTVTADATLPDWTMSLSLQKSSFSGHVTSSYGTPLTGIDMSAYEYDADSGDFVTTFTTTTDAQGAYTFVNLPVDVYGFEAHDATRTYATMEYDNESPYYQPDDFLSDPGWNDNVDFSMPRAAHITGTVTGPPSADFAAGKVTARVEVEDYSGGSPVWFDTGDVWPVGADGTYDVGDLPPDDYRLQVSDSGDPKYATATTRTIHLVEGQTVRGVDVTLVRTSSGGYVSLPPSRLLDTRSGLGVAAPGPVAPLGVVKLQVAGQGGVPSSGVSAVVLNVTVAGSTSSGFVTVWADGDPAGRPTTSSLNFLPGQIVPNLVIAPVGADGKVDLYNGSPGSTSLLADVAGYYVSGTPTTTGTFGSVTPSRLLDTRLGVGAPAKPVAPLGVVTLKVGGKGGIPDNASAVVLNVTVAGSTSSGFITVWPDGASRPTTSSLNFLPGQIVPNLVIAPVGADGKVDLYNGSPGSTSLLADVAGYFTGGTDPLTPGALGALTPARLLDTRSGVGAPSKPVAPLGVVRLKVTGRGGVPDGATAVVLNVTVAGSTSSGFITVWADNDPAGRPTTSSLNFLPGQIVPNLVIAPVGADGEVDLYNGSPGSTSLVADVAGWFAPG